MNQTEKLMQSLWSTVYRSSTDEQKISRRDAANAIGWYVGTGRASPAWIRSALRADPGKLLDRTGRGSVEDEIARATVYLRRYCKLPA